MDGNRDSQISLAEHRTATLANFDRLDTDKDGVVHRRRNEGRRDRAAR